MIDCTKATEEEKAELIKQLREAKKAKKARRKRLGELLPTSVRQVTLNQVLTLPYCPGSGSDFTVIGRSHWEMLRAADPNAEAERLDVPAGSQAFGSTWLMADRKASLHTLIHTVAGPVEPMGTANVYIVDDDDGEFIPSDDPGIDVDRQLEQLAGRGEDESSGASIELEADDIHVNMDQPRSSDDEIFAAIERLVGRTVENGFPQERVEQLRNIAHAYDVWRLGLPADLPAHVPPPERRLCAGARHTKCKPQKFPPHIRKFLHDFNARLVSLGMVYENSKSRWASPDLPVKKSADIMDLRQTTDYRALNEKTDVMAAVMPKLSLVMENARGVKHFGLFDFFLKGFDSCHLLNSARSSSHT